MNREIEEREKECFKMFLDGIDEENRKYFLVEYKVIKQIEEFYGKPIWEISVTEFVDSDVIHKNVFSQRKIYNTLLASRKFIEHGEKNNYFVPNSSWNIKFDFKNTGILKIDERYKTYIDREKVLEMCEAMPNPRDSFVLLAQYEGIGLENIDELIHIRAEDIKRDGIFVEGKGLLHVSKELIRYAKESLNTKFYNRKLRRRIYVTSDKNSENLIGSFKLEENDYVVRFIEKDEKESEFIESRRARNIKDILYKTLSGKIAMKYPVEIDSSISPYRFKNSGKVNFILERSRGYGLTPRQYLKSKMGLNEFCERFGDHNYQRLRKIVREYDWLLNH